MKKEYIVPAMMKNSLELKNAFALSTSETSADPTQPSLVKVREEEEEEEEAMIMLLKDLEEGKTSGLW
jgi:hypothetical protein